MALVADPEGQKIIVENTGYAPASAKVIEDKSYLGDFYARPPNAPVAHTQVANYGGPWYAYPDAEDVAATDLITAALIEVTEGAVSAATIKGLAENLRGMLGMTQSTANTGGRYHPKSAGLFSNMQTMEGVACTLFGSTTTGPSPFLAIAILGDTTEHCDS